MCCNIQHACPYCCNIPLKSLDQSSECVAIFSMCVPIVAIYVPLNSLDQSLECAAI